MVAGWLFVVAGLGAMVLAIWLSRKGKELAKPVFFSWFLLAGLSLVLAWDDGLMVLYTLTIWGMSYLLASQFYRPRGIKEGVGELPSEA